MESKGIGFSEGQDSYLSISHFLFLGWKNRRLFLIVFFVFVLAAIAYASVRDRFYIYSATLDIGQITSGAAVSGQVVVSFPIESAAAVAAKLNESYVPQVMLKGLQSDPDNVDVYRFSNLKARVPKDTGLVVLEVSGKEMYSDTYLKILTQVTELVQLDHRRAIDVAKAAIDGKISVAEQARAEFIDEERLVSSKLSRIDLLEKLNSRQVIELNELVKNSLTNRKAASSRGGSNEASAMTLMLIDNEVELNRNRLFEMEKRLFVDLKNERDSIEKQLADIRRSQAAQEQIIGQVKLELQALRETRLVVQPMKSLRPNPPGQMLVVFLGVFFGLVFALVVVCLREVLGKALLGARAEMVGS